jgi:hypothetical protein
MVFIVRVGPARLHGMAHVPALDARSRVLRGNIPSRRLPGCRCVEPMRTSVPLRGCMSHLAQFQIWLIVVHVQVNEILWRV